MPTERLTHRRPEAGIHATRLPTFEPSTLGSTMESPGWWGLGKKISGTCDLFYASPPHHPSPRYRGQETTANVELGTFKGATNHPPAREAQERDRP